MSEMTMRERILAVVQGRPHDRAPFVIYDGMLPLPDLDEVLGAGRIGLMRWSNVHRVEHPHCRFVDEDDWVDGQDSPEKTAKSPRAPRFYNRMNIHLFT